LNLSLKAAVLFLTLTLAAYAFAETLTGTVNNGTTGKAAAGDDVVLIKLANGMEEAARTKADAKGNFKFTFDDVGPHLIRAIHRASPITGWLLRERPQCSSMFSTWARKSKASL